MWHGATKPAWSLDLLSHPPMRFAAAGFDAPAESLTEYFNSQISKDYSWRDVEWLLGEWSGKAALKGVCRPDDALKAQAMGFDAVWLSNHGGRQLDTSPPTIELLPAVRQAVGPDLPLIIDGGIMREFIALIDPSHSFWRWRGTAGCAGTCLRSACDMLGPSWNMLGLCLPTCWPTCLALALHTRRSAASECDLV
jgi:hypothetical protein